MNSFHLSGNDLKSLEKYLSAMASTNLRGTYHICQLHSRYHLSDSYMKAEYCCW
jgi:hypothetical protein